MKKLLFFGVFALLTSTLFSCTADDFETAKDKTEAKKEINPLTGAQATGPDDDPITVPPPPKKP